METFSNGLRLKIYEGSFPLSTDSMLLSHFARLPKNSRVLDLGSGCGTLGLLLCARDESCHVTGIEIDEAAHIGALENIRQNALEARLTSIHGDLRTFRELVKPGSFGCCVSNPPYFTGGPSAKLQNARREDLCSLGELFQAAAWALKYGGDFFLVHRPERLAELFSCACSASMEPKRLCLVRHKSGDPVTLVLVQCRKGARPGLIWEELCLHDAAGTPTADYQRIYQL